MLAMLAMFAHIKMGACMNPTTATWKTSMSAAAGGFPLFLLSSLFAALVPEFDQQKCLLLGPLICAMSLVVAVRIP